jgi:hypothetical protein
MRDPDARLPDQAAACAATCAQVLYQYPEGAPLTPDAAHFCFPHGVQPSLLERTPSMSALNELVYSQQYQHSDASSFIFVLKARAGAAQQTSAPLICCTVHRQASAGSTFPALASL